MRRGGAERVGAGAATGVRARGGLTGRDPGTVRRRRWRERIRAGETTSGIGAGSTGGGSWRRVSAGASASSPAAARTASSTDVGTVAG